MIFSLVGLFFCSLAMSTVVCYAVWVWVRGYFLRQDLFAIRDDLWLAALRHERLDDPAYQSVRSHLHVLLKGGPDMSLPVIAVLRDSKPKPLPARPVSASPEFEAILLAAEDAAGERLWRYVSRDRFFSFAAWLTYVGGRIAARKLVAIWVASDDSERLARLADRDSGYAVS